MPRLWSCQFVNKPKRSRINLTGTRRERASELGQPITIQFACSLGLGAWKQCAQRARSCTLCCCCFIHSCTRTRVQRCPPTDRLERTIVILLFAHQNMERTCPELEHAHTGLDKQCSLPFNLPLSRQSPSVQFFNKKSGPKQWIPVLASEPVLWWSAFPLLPVTPMLTYSDGALHTRRLTCVHSGEHEDHEPGDEMKRSMTIERLFKTCARTYSTATKSHRLQRQHRERLVNKEYCTR